MSDRQAIIEQLRALIEARKAQVRIRIVDRAFAQLAAVLILIGFAASTASAAPLQHRSLPMRQVPPPARPAYCAPKTVIIVVPVRQSRPVIYYGGGFNPY